MDPNYSDIILRWKEANPIQCHGLGIHDYDGEVPDFSPHHIFKRIEELKKDLSFLDGMDEPIHKMERYEFNLLKSALNVELYELDINKEYLESPSPYISSWFNPLSIIETSYTMRKFASIDDRVRSFTLLEEKIPAYIQQATTNLSGKLMSKDKVRANLQMLDGYISYYSDELIEFVTQVEDENLLHSWSKANELLVIALKDFKKFLEDSLETAQDDFALGEKKFLEILKNTEGVDLPIDRLLKIGEEDLERNFLALKNIADERSGGDIHALMKETEGDYPAPHDLLEYTEITLERCKKFVEESNLVDIPYNDQCKAIHTPKSMRKFAFAAMNTPGPFEVPEAAESYYWVTPPDPNWSKEKTHDFMKLFSKATFESITVHEAWPGHYLQLLFSNTTKSEIAKMFAFSYSMIEGWAHYTEEMIYEQGYQPFERWKLHLGQLIEALIRNVRYVCSIKMHCKGMGVAEAKQLFMSKSFLSEVNAEIEANRGTIDPMYLNYTLGKLMIKKLLNDYKQEKGPEFSLKEFHNEFLSYGSPTITVLRDIMLQNNDGKIL